MDIVLIVRVTVAVLEGVRHALKEVNRRLQTKTIAYNEALLALLDAFLVRVKGECIEDRQPGQAWVRDFKRLGDDVVAHVATCDRQATETRSMTTFESICANARAKKLLKEATQLSLSMDFASSVPTTG